MTKYIVLLLLLIPIIGSTQTEKKLYSVNELQEDFMFWREKLEAKSPILYYYNTKAKTDRYLDSIYALLDHPMTDVEFYKTIAPTSFFLKDIHSGVQASTLIDKNIIDHPSIIPIDIVWTGNSAVIAVSDSLNQIKKGSQVISINGVDTKEIFQRGFHLYSNDGYSTANSEFNVNANFWLTYHRIYGHSEAYTIEYITITGERQTTIIKGTNWRSIWEMRKGLNRPMFKDDLPLITLNFIDSMNSAVLTVRSFDNKLFKEAKQGKFDPQIKAAIKQIEEQQPAHLILDIRANGGGDPMNGKLLLKYLLNDTFHISHELRTVGNANETSFYERTKKVHWPFFGLGKFKPYKNRYHGNVYVLIDGGVSSAAGEFSGVLKRNSSALFIGSEAGGNASLVGGTYLKQKLYLPNTRLHVSVNKICSVNDKLENDLGYGVIPDYAVRWTPSDFAMHKDPVLSLTYSHITKANLQEEALGHLKDSINALYGLYQGAPRVNSGPCGNFANLFYSKWNERFDQKVTISFIMSADSSECYHVLVKLPNGDYYDGGNGVLTKRQLIEGYEKGMYIIDMLNYDYQLLDEISYGLEREYPRCPNYSVEKTSEIIDFHLDQLKLSIN